MAERKPLPPNRRAALARREDVVSVVGRCDLFATFAMSCPLCGVEVPANTPHSCKRLERKASRRV